MSEDDNAFPINEKEVMEYYGYSGSFGRLKIKTKFLRSWILHSLAYSSPHSNFIIKMQKARGVKIGEKCYFNPYVLIDLVYPTLIKIEDNVSIGSNVMIFAHGNISANSFLKGKYPRKVSNVSCFLSKSSILSMPLMTEGVCFSFLMFRFINSG